jgi:hypothetical protein
MLALRLQAKAGELVVVAAVAVVVAVVQWLGQRHQRRKRHRLLPVIRTNPAAAMAMANNKTSTQAPSSFKSVKPSFFRDE